MRDRVEQHQLDYFKRIRGMELRLPTLVGFGISNRSTFQAACSQSRGAIIGSAFIRLLGEGDAGLEEGISEFLGEVLGS